MSTRFKHTLGPWKSHGYDLRSWTGRYIGYFGPTSTSPRDYPLSCKLEDEANAVLAAASPDLLAALRWILSEAPAAEAGSPYFEALKNGNHVVEKVLSSIES